MQKARIRRVLPVTAAGFVLLVLAVSLRTAHRPVFASGKAMPELQFVTLDGTPWRLSEQHGRVVLLNFWATWCPPCRMETPGLVSVANALRSQGLVVAGVSMDGGAPDLVRTFATQYHISYPILLPQQDSPLLEQVDSLPTTVFIDRQGRIARSWVGAMPEEAFRQEAERLLAQR